MVSVTDGADLQDFWILWHENWKTAPVFRDAIAPSVCTLCWVYSWNAGLFAWKVVE